MFLSYSLFYLCLILKRYIKFNAFKLVKLFSKQWWFLLVNFLNYKKNEKKNLIERNILVYSIVGIFCVFSSLLWNLNFCFITSFAPVLTQLIYSNLPFPILQAAWLLLYFYINNFFHSFLCLHLSPTHRAFVSIQFNTVIHECVLCVINGKYVWWCDMCSTYIKS